VHLGPAERASPDKTKRDASTCQDQRSTSRRLCRLTNISGDADHARDGSHAVAVALALQPYLGRQDATVGRDVSEGQRNALVDLDKRRKTSNTGSIDRSIEGRIVEAAVLEHQTTDMLITILSKGANKGNRRQQESNAQGTGRLVR